MVSASQQVPNIPQTTTAKDYDFDYANLSASIHLRVNNSSQYDDGKTIFTTRRKNNAINTPGKFYDQYVTLVMDMNGNILNTYRTHRNGVYFVDPEMINSTTAVMENDTVFFWNMETGVVQDFPIPAGTHDLEYNPFTHSFLSKYWSFTGNYSKDGVNYYPILYNDLYEYDMQGNVLWYWNSTAHFPFNPDLADCGFAIGAFFWMSANSVFWDYSNNLVYLNARSLDTFYEIDKATGDVNWGLGRLGNFTMYNKRGEQVDSLFYHAHAVEKISDNHFILFDNDYHNLTTIANGLGPNVGTPRLVEIEVNTDTMEAHEVWSYTAPSEYFSINWGDADRLPNGDTLGKFGQRGVNRIVEVNPAGDTVWNLELENTSQFEYGVYRAERFYDNPVVKTSSEDLTMTGNDVTIPVSVWENIKLRHDTPGTVTISEGDKTLLNESFVFKRYWQEQKLNLTVPGLSSGSHVLSLKVTNQDGRSTTLTINVNSSTSKSTPLNSMVMFASLLVALPLIRRKFYKNS